MSSFVLFTQHGPPDLIVEVGTPISSDPILLSGLFKAIMSFTDELAQAPLQVLQTKGFTVQFKPMFDDYVLIVGTDHTILGLDLILNQIGDIVSHGFQQGHDIEIIEHSIKEVLNNYVEYGSKSDTEVSGAEVSELLIEILQDIPEKTYKILLYSLLAGYGIKYPHTNSMDLNRAIIKFAEFIDQECYTDLDPTAPDMVEILDKSDKFNLMHQPYKIKNVIRETKLLKELLTLIQEEKYAELRLKLISELGMLSQLERVFLEFDQNNHTHAEQEEIDQFRYLIGHELEHYLLLRLHRKDKQLVKYLQNNTKHTEWLSSW